MSFLKVNSLRKIAPESFEVFVNSTPLCVVGADYVSTPMVLSLETLLIESLLGFRQWKPKPQLSYMFKAPNETDAKFYSGPVCEALLKDL